MNIVKSKNLLTTTTLLLALLQGPYIYYYTTGFFRMLVTIFYGTTGLLMTINLARKILKQKNSNTRYHYIGLSVAFIIGLLTIRQDNIVYLGWKFRLNERTQVVANVKKGLIKPNNYGICHISSHSILPLSNGGNNISLLNNKNGITSIEFYTDRGFIDHYSALLYTDNPTEITEIENSLNNKSSFYKKLSKNWYTYHY
jgi:hypothetical protein